MQRACPATTLTFPCIGSLRARTIGDLRLYPEENRFDRGEALKLYTIGSSWFSTEDWEKGAIAPGQHADLAILSADYFSIPEEEIKLKPNTYVSLRTIAAHGRSLSVSFSSSA